MGRSAILGIAIIGAAAIFFALRYVKPAGEQAQANQKILTHAYTPRLIDCRELEIEEIPESLARPGVDEDLVYLAVVVLYPGVDRVPEPLAHRLLGVNGEKVALDPADVIYAEADEGTEATVIFRTNNAFRFAKLVHGEDTIAERIELE